MDTHETDEWRGVEVDYRSGDFERENVAFDRERDRLIRDHLGKVALVHGDDVVGVFDDPGQAIIEGYERFGHRQFIVCLIEKRDPAEDIAYPAARPPSFKPLA